MQAIFQIVGIQKHWGHNELGKYVPNIIGYRVKCVGVDDKFGCVGPVKDILFVKDSIEDSIEKNIRIYDFLKNK